MSITNQKSMKNSPDEFASACIINEQYKRVNGCASRAKCLRKIFLRSFSDLLNKFKRINDVITTICLDFTSRKQKTVIKKSTADMKAE